MERCQRIPYILYIVFLGKKKTWIIDWQITNFINIFGCFGQMVALPWKKRLCVLMKSLFPLSSPSSLVSPGSAWYSTLGREKQLKIIRLPDVEFVVICGVGGYGRGPGAFTGNQCGVFASIVSHAMGTSNMCSFCTAVRTTVSFSLLPI